MPTLEEIAKLTGVSRSTVSRVINNDPHVSEETRQNVMVVVRELNFQPNVAARSLATGRSSILGLVIPTRVASLFTDPYFPALIQGASMACNAQNYSTMLWLAEPEYERRTIQQVINIGLLDGVVVSSMMIDDPIVAALKDSKIPFVLVGRHPSAEGISYVDVDNVNSAREIVTYLLRLGYRRIATITGPLNLISGRDRYQGYQEALHSRGVALDEELVVEGDYTEEGGYLGMQRLLSKRPRAVFAASDLMASGALRALREAGLQVPSDVAIVGFDDLPTSARLVPPLTTMRQSVSQLGSVAVEILLDLIQHPGTGPHRVILPTQLVIRESCGSNLNF